MRPGDVFTAFYVSVIRKKDNKKPVSHRSADRFFESVKQITSG